MKIHRPEAVLHPESRQALRSARATARQSFRETQGHVRNSIRKLREELAQKGLSQEQRVQVDEAFERFFKQSQTIAKEFHRSRATDPGSFQHQLGELTQDLHAAIETIVGEEEAYAGPTVSRSFLGGTGVGARLDVNA